MKQNVLEKQKAQKPKSELEKTDAYWRAANYLSVAQRYLWDNVLLKEKLERKHIKNRIITHWGTVPGQNFIYTHLNRVIKKYDLDLVLLSGPGHGGLAWSANAYLEGSMSEHYPEFSQDEAGFKNLCRMHSFPGGLQSHVAADMPGSIHEGGELGYCLTHGAGAVFDNPGLIAAVIVGDGEAETGPMATSWHTNKFINPITDGAVLPILHLNGYKVANPTVLARIPKKELEAYLVGCGWKPYFAEGSDPKKMHALMSKTLDTVIEEIRALQQKARTSGDGTRPAWPMIVLRSPNGWTSPKEVDGMKMEDSHNIYRVPIKMTKPHHVELLEEWLKSYRPHELFGTDYKLLPELRELAPVGNARIGSNPHTNCGVSALALPDLESYAVDVSAGRGKAAAQDNQVLSYYLRDIIKNNPANFRLFGPDETESNGLPGVYEATKHMFNAELYEDDKTGFVAREGRILDAYLSEHCCEGWLEGYVLTGRHGMFITYESFGLIASTMLTQHSKWLKLCRNIPWRKDVPALNLLLTTHVWQQEHNGCSHQEPAILNHLATKGDLADIYLAPDANCLLYIYNRCARDTNKINAIVSSKHRPDAPQWLSLEEAAQHCAQGLGVWEWASNGANKPDTVLACAGDVITRETLAAAKILKENLPELKFRFINTVDLMKLSQMPDNEYDELFTKDKPIIFNFHGLSDLVRGLTAARTNRNLSVHGYIGEGNVSTPFDIRVQNKADRFNVVLEVLNQLPPKLRKSKNAAALEKLMKDTLNKHHAYIREFGVDMPEVTDWEW